MNSVIVLALVALVVAGVLFYVFRGRRSKNVLSKIKLISGPSVHNDAMATQLLSEGKPLLIGGLAIIGNEGYMVRTVCFLQQTGTNAEGEPTGLKGWSYFVDKWPDLKHSGFQHFDTTKNEVTELALPSYMSYVVAEIDTSLLEPSASKRELQAAADYAVTFIHD